ncbi:tripartite tricarboxylate transporter substrate binding protein [Saccharospirillum impatiens]|uniref:tripartite tricarboxylate transporter substrate binding protein n=1 Tax=Saccharospirillum impatiens TaxID=169438 RepID=UPI000687B056|nr:tripartite tricarboxylate transporter substrate binding protein [Saccharospirillum impatiens]
MSELMQVSTRGSLCRHNKAFRLRMGRVISSPFVVCVAGLLALSALLGVHASGFPNRPLTMVIGFNPGGSTDIQAQALADILEEELGQPVERLYLPGAGGGVAAALVASSTDQGYLMMFGSSLPYTFTPLVTDASYDLNSFRYVSALALDQSALVTGGNKPYRTWEEFLEYARAQGKDELTVASQTSQDRFVINMISRREGIPMRIVPTTGGAGMAPMVLAGDVDFAFSGGTHTQYTESGEMVVLMGLVEERLVGYPDAPAIGELGYDVSMQNPRVLVVPEDTPDDQVSILSAALFKATQDPRFIQATGRVRLPITFWDEARLQSYFEQQVDDYRWLIQEYGEPDEN